MRVFEQVLDSVEWHGTGVVLTRDHFTYLGLLDNVDMLMNQVAIH